MIIVIIILHRRPLKLALLNWTSCKNTVYKINEINFLKNMDKRTSQTADPYWRSGGRLPEVKWNKHAQWSSELAPELAR